MTFTMILLLYLVVCAFGDSSWDDCNSPYWRQAEDLALTDTGDVVDLSFENVVELAAGEGGPAENAGCEWGRLWLSVWQLVHMDSSERAWHLKSRFGLGLYGHSWRPKQPWPVFTALARLRQKVQQDPAHLYPDKACDAISSGQRGGAANEEFALRDALMANLSDAGVAAAHFLHGDSETSCPLAACAAFWAIGVAVLMSRGPVTSLDPTVEGFFEAWRECSTVLEFKAIAFP